MKYECILGVKIGDVIHNPGEIIDLTDDQANICLRRQAVVPTRDAPTVTSDPVVSVVSTVTLTRVDRPTPAQLVEEAAKLVADAEDEVKASAEADAQ